MANESLKVIPSQTSSMVYSLNEMRMSNTLCDATIKLDDTTTFSVHRAVLCAGSDYFRSLFTTSLNGDKMENDFFLPGIRKEIMCEILDYIYVRNCLIDEGIVFELYVIADYLGVMGLVNLCIKFIIGLLTPINCLGIMLFAQNRFSPKLYDKARNYVMINFLQMALKSNELTQLNIDHFFDIIRDDQLNTKNEEPVWECCIRWIEHDSENRKQYISRLMSGIRLGLLNTRYFMEQVKEHAYVTSSPETKPIIFEALTFLYDLDMISARSTEIPTPALAQPRIPHEVIFAIYGWCRNEAISAISTYDTRADRWVTHQEEDPAGPKAYHGAAVVGHNIYCIGGYDGDTYFNSCRVFDTVEKSWKEIAPMHYRRAYVSTTQLDGIIYAMGGYDGLYRHRSAEKYDPKTNQWTIIASMHFKRSDADACTLNSKVYVTGGFNGQQCLNNSEYYNPVTDTWSMISNMRHFRSGLGCVAHNGYIYAVGGFNGQIRIKSAERYDPNRNRWTSIPEMYYERSNFGIEVIDDEIMAIGGYTGSAILALAECYRIDSNEWVEATDLPFPRSAFTASIVTGLPNIKDYLHLNRESLMEERRQRMLQSSDESI